MSEHYDFHYQPTGSGAISGQQVLEQTEDAINELGDYVNDNVGGAMDVAQQALETAQNAEQDAQTALDTANSFSSAIQSAQQDASTALSTASNANNTAIQAQQDASSAVTTANNASGQVSTLSGTVTALGQRVTTAEGNITTLQNDVSIAQGNASSAMATAGTVKQQAYVFRYSSTVLVASSTNSNALLDNTDNLKVGDKVIDSSGVLFSITAIDTANSTFTIGTALIDLALDSDVVHKSGDETITGAKTFTDNNMIKTSSPKVLLINTSQTGNTAPSSNTASFFRFDGGTVNNFGGVQCEFITTGENRLTNYVKDITTAKLNSIQQRANNTTAMTVFNADLIIPSTDGITALGSSSKRWSDVQTYKVNALEPSSLSLPSGNASNIIDISSYITNLNGTSNRYTVPANGWISIAITGTAIAIVSSSWSDSRLRESSGNVRMLYPVLKNETLDISVIGTTLTYARFIPCQGNV